MTISARMLRLGLDVAALVVCALGAAFALADVRSPARPYVVLIAIVLGLGWAATSWVPTRDAAYAGTLALAAGVAIPMLVSLFFVEVHWWHPVGTAGVLLIVAAGVNTLALVRRARQAPES